MQVLRVHYKADANGVIRVVIPNNPYADEESYLCVLVITTPTFSTTQPLRQATPDAFRVPLLNDGYYTLQVKVYDLADALLAESRLVQLHNSAHAYRRLRTQQAAVFAGGVTDYRRTHMALDQALFEACLGNPVGFINYLR